MKKLAILGLVFLLGLGLGVSAYAQETGTGTGATTYDTARNDDDGMDLGWLGLLGLAGLLGLKRREVHRDVRTTAPASR